MAKASSKRRIPRRIFLSSGCELAIDETTLRKARSEGTSELALLEQLDSSASKPLTMQDAHVLRALFRWAGIIEEPLVSVRCENCGDVGRVRPSDHLEFAPFFDGELDDAVLDSPFRFGRHRVGPIFIRGGTATQVTVAPRFLEDLAVFWSSGERTFDLSRSALSAAGLVRIGRESSASRISKALFAASNRRRNEVLEVLDRALYVERLTGAFPCLACGARVRVYAPAERHDGELSPPLQAARRLVDIEQFEALVEVAVRKVFARRAVRNIDVFVDDGVPWVDEGGEPLLGCYTPFDPDDMLRPRPEIRLFLRSFQADAEAFADFDVEREVLETIDHEVEHHLGFLAGDDPLDVEERVSIAREQATRIGKAELLRRESSGLIGDASRFLRATWPLWLGLVAYVLLRDRW